MSTPIFLAWTLAATGLCGLILWHLRRRAVADNAVLPPQGVGQLALMLVLVFLTSALVIKLVCDLFVTAPLPGWTRLILGPLLVAVGLSRLFDGSPGRTSFPSERVLGAVMLVLGAAITVMETYHYAISLGTAASMSLS